MNWRLSRYVLSYGFLSKKLNVRLQSFNCSFFGDDRFLIKKADACLITLLLKVMQLVRANFFSSLVFLFLNRPQCLAQSFKAIKTQVDVCSNCQAHQSWLFLKWNIRGQKAKLWLGVCQNPSGPFFIRRTYSVKWS